jgi:hypothetical protein
MWREVLRDVPDFRIELVEVVADEADTVVVEVDFLGMGRANGADIRTTVYQAASFRHGKVASVQGSALPRRPFTRWGYGGRCSRKSRCGGATNTRAVL